MNLPNIPTDNLYKFMAITGLIFVISANILYFLFGDRLIQTTTTFLQNEAVNSFEQETMTQRITADRKAQLALTNQLSTASEQQRKTITDELNKLQTKLDSEDTKFEEVGKNALSNDTSLNTLWQQEQVRYMKLVLSIGTYGGILMSLVGFFLWYIKLQRYQDKLIKQKAEK